MLVGQIEFHRTVPHVPHGTGGIGWTHRIECVGGTSRIGRTHRIECIGGMGRIPWDCPNCPIQDRWDRTDT